MTDLAEMLEHELEEAFELKDKKALHRYTVLLAENIVQKSIYEQSILEIKSDVKVIAETMKIGFQSVDKRFEDMYSYMNKRFEDMYSYMNKRFEDMNKRFSMMFTFMNIGFGIIIFLTVLFKFIQ